MSDVLKILNGQINAEGQSIVNLGDPSSTQDASTKNYVDNIRSIPLGTVGAGGVSGVLGTAQGGSGLSSIGTSSQILGVNTAGTALEFKTFSGTSNQVIVTPSAGNFIFSLPQSIATISSPTFAGLTVNPGPLFVGTTSGIINSNESISNQLNLTTPLSAQANAFATLAHLAGTTATSVSVSGSFSQAYRQCSTDVTETSNLTGASYGVAVDVPTGHAYTNSSGNALAGMTILPLGLISGGTIVANYQSVYVAQDNTTITGIKTSILVSAPSGGSIANIVLGDSQTATGNWFIWNSSGNPSRFGGQLQLSNGSAASPSYAFFSDINGGIYRNSGSSNVQFATNSTNAGGISSSQAWTIGASGGTQAHAVNGNLTITSQLEVGSNTLDSRGLLGIGGTHPLTGTSVSGLEINYTSNSNNTAQVIGVEANITTAASTAITNMYTYRSTAPNIGAGGSVTRFIELFTTAGSNPATNNAAIADSNSFTGNWFIYQNGTNNSLFSGAVKVGTTGTVQSANEQVSILLSQVAPSGSGASALGTTCKLTSNSPQTATLTGGNFGATRSITVSTTDTQRIVGYAGSIDFDVPAGQTLTNTTNAVYAACRATPCSVNGGGAIAINIYTGVHVAADSTPGITNKMGILLSGVSGGTNNAFIADNTSFTGNWLINLSAATPSFLGGSLDVSSTVTRGNAYYSQQALTSNASVTAATLTNFPSQTALSFTPPVTANYRIEANVTAYGDSSNIGANNVIAIRATTGSPTYLAYGDLLLTIASTNNYYPTYVYVDVTLTGGVAYAFQVQGQTSAGSFKLDNSHTANGTYITARQLN